MILHTASEGITLAKQLETESAGFYQEMANKFPDKAEVFSTWASENKKFIVQIERAYYGVITDALEGSYAFTALDSDHYVLQNGIAGGSEKAENIRQAIHMEEVIIEFYREAAKQSQSLLADVPRAFTIIARKRENRITTLKSLLEN